MDFSDEWEGNSGKAYISPEKLQQVAEALKTASSQPKILLLNLNGKRILRNDRHFTEKSLRRL